MSQDINVPVDISALEPDEPTKKHLTAHQKRAIAMMAVNGLPNEVIAKAVGKRPAYIKRKLSEDPEIAVHVAEIEGRLLKTMAVHHMEMTDKLDLAREAINQGLTSNDLKIRLDTSWKLIEHTVPKSTQRVEVEFSGETKHTVEAAAVIISGSLTELKQVLTGTNANFENSVKTELPGPVSIEPVKQATES